MPALVAYRIAAWDTPFWVSPNRAARRFNKYGRGPVQYWSLHPLTPWAEVIRGQGFVDPEDINELRQRIWAARLRLTTTEITFDNAPDFGLEPHHLVSDDYGACQEFGDACLRAPKKPKAIVVPSAALPGTKNLVIFGPRVIVPYLMEPLGTEDSPTSIVAEDALPPEALIPLVMQFGHEHKGFQAWERGEVLEFQEPVTTRPA